jgi:hypothetical protein
MEVQKLRTAQARFCASRSDVYHFLPFAVEVLGHLGPLAIGFIRQVSALIEERSPSLNADRDTTWSLYLAVSRVLAIAEDHLLEYAAHKLFGGPDPLVDPQVVTTHHSVERHAPRQLIVDSGVSQQWELDDTDAAVYL